MSTISLCMIVKNEEDVLNRCLSSAVLLVDEIIVVDTGSTDATKEIAKAFTDMVYDFVWIDDFAAARNFAFSKARGEYVMWLDADDVITQENMTLWLAVKQNLGPETDTVMGRYNTGFDEKGNTTFFYYRERILHNCKSATWQGAVHEVIVPFGNIIYTDAAIDHKKTRPSPSDRNLKIYESQKQKGVAFSPRDLFYFGREQYYNAQYKKAIATLTQMINIKQGWLENKLEACKVMAQCHAALGNYEDAKKQLLHSLLLDVPRAEICCDLGALFLEEQRYKEAIFWYETALGCVPKPDSGAFVMADCYNFIPHIQLCVCHYRLGAYKKAAWHNEQAALYKKEHSSVLGNREILKAYV